MFSSPGPWEIPAELEPGFAKVQTLAGGRARGGGVVPFGSRAEASALVAGMLERGFDGETVTEVLLEERIEADAELFLGITYDPHEGRPFVLLSERGGVDVEEIAAAEPDAVKRLALDLRRPFRGYHAVEWLSALGFRGKRLRGLADVVTRLVGTFLDHDATLLEINPLARTAADEFVALDCHIEIDDDALPRVASAGLLGSRATRSTAAETDLERRAREIDALDYRGVAGRVVECGGNLGLLIGGGGASLTVFDAVQHHGGRPANYCEIGGNPTVRKVKELTQLLVSRPAVEKLAVIMNVVSNTQADLVARGVIKGIIAAGRDPRALIVVFRIPGSGEPECRKLLAHYDIPFSGRDLPIDDAAALAVARTQPQPVSEPAPHGHVD